MEDQIMATNAQINASRTNAQKSTGPKTPEGKARTAQNATKHGLTASATLITGEDPADFQLHREALLADLAPQGALQQLFAERIISLSWRLNRAVRIQDATMDAMIEEAVEQFDLDAPFEPADMTPQEAQTAIGKAINDYGKTTATLERLFLYEHRIEQSLYKALNQLEKLQAAGNHRPQLPKPLERPEKTDADHESHSKRSATRHSERIATCHSERAQSRRAGKESTESPLPHHAQSVIPSAVEESTEHPQSPQATRLTRSLPLSLSEGLRPACSVPHNPDVSEPHLKKQTQSSNPVPPAATRHSECSEESIENNLPLADRPAPPPPQNQLEKTNPIPEMPAFVSKR
jgi:hypothetical protein